jgi:hypothetical protein
VLVSVIDEQLRELFRLRLVDNKKIAKEILEGTGPLATFSARIEMGVLVGLYPTSFARVLHALRKIRNEFAHSTGLISLDSAVIEIEARPLVERIKKFSPGFPNMPARDRFISACEFVLGGLAGISSDVKRLSNDKLDGETDTGPDE